MATSLGKKVKANRSKKSTPKKAKTSACEPDDKKTFSKEFNRTAAAAIRAIIKKDASGRTS